MMTTSGRVPAQRVGHDEARVLLLAPAGADGEETRGLLSSEGLTCAPCASLEALAAELQAGAALAIIDDDALTLPAVARLSEVVGRQAPWSDLPLIVLTRAGTPVEDQLARLTPGLDVTLLERPVRAPVLRSLVQAALRARRRQYELRDLLARLEEADRSKDRFMAQLGHELRTPLDAIRNAAALIDIVEGPSRDPRAQRARAVIERQSQNLTRLIDDLMDVARIASGRLAIRHEHADLSGVVVRVVQAAEPRARGRCLALDLTLPDAPVHVQGDAVRLEQVVTNLLNNALKYTPEGGHVWVTLDELDGTAVLRVRDDGMGIDPELLPRLFVPFSQADAALERAQGGLGLGLALVRQLVTLHGGSVEARSDGVGRGATFEVRLPVV